MKSIENLKNVNVLWYCVVAVAIIWVSPDKGGITGPANPKMQALPKLGWPPTPPTTPQSRHLEPFGP